MANKLYTGLRNLELHRIQEAKGLEGFFRKDSITTQFHSAGAVNRHLKTIAGLRNSMIKLGCTDEIISLHPGLKRLMLDDEHRYHAFMNAFLNKAMQTTDSPWKVLHDLNGYMNFEPTPSSHETLQKCITDTQAVEKKLEDLVTLKTERVVVYASDGSKAPNPADLKLKIEALVGEGCGVALSRNAGIHLLFGSSVPLHTLGTNPHQHHATGFTFDSLTLPPVVSHSAIADFL